MGVIRFIQGIAFVSSIFSRIMAIPFKGFCMILNLLHWGIKQIYALIYKVCNGIRKGVVFFFERCWKRHILVGKNENKSSHGVFRYAIKVYRVSYTILQKIYWGIYVQSRELYKKMVQNDYVDIFVIFLRGYLNYKHKKNVQYFPICGVKEYVSNYSSETFIHVLEKGMKREVCIPEYFEKSEEKIYIFHSPDIYVANVYNVEIIAGSAVVLAEGRLLNDAVSYDKENRIDIRYGAIKKVFRKGALIEIDKDIEEIQGGIDLIGAASFNYYHLVVEILSRLTFIDEFEKYREYPILVDEIVLQIPQFSAALECINKYNHKVISLKKNKRYKVCDMLLPSSNVWLPINLYDREKTKVEDFMIAETVLRNIRNALNLYTERKPWRKVFVSRKNTTAVRLKNEERIREIFAQEGFEIVHTEEMTFAQQIECFGQAKCVVAATGAALTNIIFCQPGTIIGCIIPSYGRFYTYSTIAHLIGLRPLFLDAEIVELTPYVSMDKFVLDEGYAKRYAEYIVNYEK